VIIDHKNKNDEVIITLYLFMSAEVELKSS